jgi:hypothetical protein
MAAQEAGPADGGGGRVDDDDGDVDAQFTRKAEKLRGQEGKKKVCRNGNRKV